MFATGAVPLDAVKAYAAEAFTQGNIAVIGSGVSESTLAKLVQSKLSSLPSGSKSASTSSKYYGGESRINSHDPISTLFIGFGTSSPTPALSVLAAYLDPTPSLKWTEGTSPLSKLPAGVSAQVVHDNYSDGALFGVIVQGSDAAALKEAGQTVVQALKGIENALKGDAFTKAVAKAKFAVASALEGTRDVSSTVLAYQVR